MQRSDDQFLKDAHIKCDSDLSAIMRAAKDGAHESRRIQWQAEADELINREREYDCECDGEHEWRAVQALSRQLATADNAFRREYHRAEVLKVKVENWKFASGCLLFAVLGLVAKVLRWF